MFRRSAFVAPLAAVALSVTVPLSGAVASDGTRGAAHSVRVAGTGASDPNVPIGVSCDATGRCLVSTLVPGSITGGVAGPTVTRGAAYGDTTTGDYFGGSVIMITGTVAGCGEGSMTMSLGDFSGNLALPAAATGVVVPGSGTGALAGVTGRGEFHFSPGVGGAGTYSYSMKLRCRRM